MVFSSVTFLFIFLPVTLLLYYLVPEKGKNFVLLILSLVFYAWGEPLYVLLMIYSILFNYWMGLLMEKHAGAKKQILIFSVIINLFIIGFFLSSAPCSFFLLFLILPCRTEKGKASLVQVRVNDRHPRMTLNRKRNRAEKPFLKLHLSFRLYTSAIPEEGRR